MSELSEIIARHIFECGDELNSPTHRIQFMDGKWPTDNERNQGGLCEVALVDVIDQLPEIQSLQSERDELREALEKARHWLEGWGSAETELEFIEQVLSKGK